jgi:hypothetical protein
LASVRDAKALDKLPVHEREAWQKLWADVAEVLKKLDLIADQRGLKDKGNEPR